MANVLIFWCVRKLTNMRYVHFIPTLNVVLSSRGEWQLRIFCAVLRLTLITITFLTAKVNVFDNRDFEQDITHWKV